VCPGIKQASNTKHLTPLHLPHFTAAQCGATCCCAESMRCTPRSSNLRWACLATVWVFGLTGCWRFLMKIHRRTSSSICRLRWIFGKAAGRTRKFICHISACTTIQTQVKSCRQGRQTVSCCRRDDRDRTTSRHTSVYLLPAFLIG